MNRPAGWMDEPRRWPLVAQPSNRSESYLKDARLVNCYAEQDPTTAEYEVEKRFGYTTAATLINGGQGRGMYTWYQSGTPTPIPIQFAVVGNGLNASLFKNGAVTGTGLGLTDSGGNWSFTETQGSTRFMIFAGVGIGGGANLYYTSGTGWTQATLPAGRGNFIVGIAYLDGTIYFMDENCNVFGSNLEDPTTWSTLNLIIPKKIPGTGVALVRQQSYIIALKTASMEVLYDAVNLTGSPLSQVDGATNAFGCADRNLVQTIDGVVIYGTSNQTGSIQFVRIDNLVPTIVSTPQIDRLFNSAQELSGTFYSWVIKYGGHRYYGVSHDILDITMVYDIDQKLWYQWTEANGSYMKIQSSGISSTFAHQFLHALDGGLYTFANAYTTPTDNGSPAPVDIYTPSTDFDTRRGKVLTRMYMRTDQTPGGVLYIRRSDNDYQSWSNYRKVDLSRKVPYIDNEGRFVKRAYHFRHVAAAPFRIRSADLQMAICTA